jgi:hypothetical protein
LAPQPSLGLGLLLKIRLDFLEASQQFSFLQGRYVSPTPNPHPGGPGLCIYIPQRQGGYPFMESEISLPCSQKPATGPYPEPHESTPHQLIIFLFDSFCY